MMRLIKAITAIPYWLIVGVCLVVLAPFMGAWISLRSDKWFWEVSANPLEARIDK